MGVWYVDDVGRRSPTDLATLQARARKGELRPADRIVPPGTERFVFAHEIPELRQSFGIATGPERVSPQAPVAARPATVRVVDLDMPFGSMVRFMVKWAVAAIPAILIISLVVAVIVAVTMGVLGGFLTGLVSR